MFCINYYRHGPCARSQISVFSKPIKWSFVSKVVGNILARYSRVQSIDVRRAMFSFTAKFVIVWQDPRLRFCNQTSTEALDDSLLGEIWTPHLKVRATEFKVQHKSKSISQKLQLTSNRYHSTHT